MRLVFSKNLPSLFQYQLIWHLDGGRISVQILECDKARQMTAPGVGKEAHDQAGDAAQRRQILKDALKFLW